MQASSSINLVKSRTDLIDEILKWALNFGRLLVIIVEVVAFSAFIWRFSLDRELIDLNDKIRDEQAIIEATKEREATYRNLHERLFAIKSISAQGNESYKIVNDIIALTPPNVTFNTFTMEDGEIVIDCNVVSISSLTSFINSLREYPRIGLVTITSIQNQSQLNSINITITAKLKEVPNENNF